MGEVPISNFNEAPNNIRYIVNSIKNNEERKKLINWINELIDDNYSNWESMMGDNL